MEFLNKEINSIFVQNASKTVTLNMNFNSRKTPVYVCGLDAEMAFDGVPHSVLLHKAIDAIPTPWW